MCLIMKPQLAWSQAYVLHYTASYPTEVLASFALESSGRTDRSNPIHVCCNFGKHVQIARFPLVRKITSILFLEGREEDNDRLKEFIFISALLHYSASPYCSCLQPSAAALLQEAGLCVTSRGAEARVCIANSQNHKLKQAVEPLLFIISF